MNIRKLIIGIIFSLIVGLGTIATLTMLSSNNQDAGTFKTPTPSNTPLNQNQTSTPLVIKATRPSASNCVFPMQVWVKYPAAWPIEVFEIGGVLYDQTQMIKIIKTNSRDIPQSLMKELIVTALDDRFGADTGEIAVTYNEAVQWFLDHAGQTNIPGKELQDATRLMQILQNFNTGLTGPGLCDYSLFSWLETRTPLPTEFADGTGTLNTHTPIVFGAKLPIVRTPTYNGTRYYFTQTYTPSPQPNKPKPKPKATSVPPTQPPPTAPPPPPPTDPPPPPTLVPTTGSEPPTAVSTPG